ncbi:hypothetical protein OTK49_28435 [Vibrio coralliirubri]|uniref:hypothetical protein n=1 Tax=Vibrio coralliirubri TaxID=1516159 RepID=UPI0022846D70|nr:hypothetical protein [Vibrio coralliirubri]MCY9866472.1 hypothetical protein [Vibrio coralliirubri]
MTTKTPRMITFCERKLTFIDMPATAPSIELTQLILDLALGDNLPDPQFVSSAGGDDAVYFGVNSYSRATYQLFASDATVGISIVTGKATTANNTESYNIQFLLNSKNWFVHLNEWKALGMSESTKNNIEVILTNLLDLTCSVKHTTLSADGVQASIALMQ